jgi:hypothetical protein
MIDIENRIKAFSELGNTLVSFDERNRNEGHHLEILIRDGVHYNGWFTEENVRNAIVATGESLKDNKIKKWLEPYMDELLKSNNILTIGVVMAGNVPAVGFHDFLCVLMSGNRFLGKMSSDDNKLMPAIADILIGIEPDFKEYIEFTEDKLQNFDAIIATGSNNTSRYFDYYFGKYPNIIRKNRNGVAVLTGSETEEELKKLGKDIFQYFGLGCRSVSKLFVPEGYDFKELFEALSGYENITHHHKYSNNYDYNRSIYLLNKTEHFDNGFLMVKEDTAYASPPSVLYFEYYDNISSLSARLEIERENIQCIVGNPDILREAVPFGDAQKPELWEYADGVDTMGFLIGLK